MYPAVLTEDPGMRASRLFSLLRRRRPAPTTSLGSRMDVRPPALWGQAEPVWLALWHWLSQNDVADRRRLAALQQARADFCAALAGLDHPAARDLMRRAEHARSLREVWHLRAELYSIVARHLSQSEANRRLAPVNRHFSHGTASGRPSQLPRDHDHLV